MKKKVYVIYFCLLIMLAVFIVQSCSDSSTGANPDIHAELFDISDNPIVSEGNFYYMVKLKSSLTDIPDNLIIPTRKNGKKVEGLLNNAFGTYHLKNIHVHSDIKYIPYTLFLDSDILKITLPKRFKDKLLFSSTSEVVYY